MRGPRVIGGVCSGIAEYFDVDAVLARVTAIVLALLSTGLVVIPYIALWVILPSPSSDFTPVDVDPVSVSSERYNHVVDSHDRRSAPQGSSYGVYAGAGHIPPQPPVGGSEQAGPQPRPCMYSQPTPVAAEKPDRKTSSYLLPGILFLGLSVLFFACAKVLTFITPVASVAQFFPFIFVVCGITLMVCPFKRSSLVPRICVLLFCLELCVLFLSYSTGVVHVEDMASLGDLTILLWFALGCLSVAALVFCDDRLSLAVVVLFAIVLLLSFGEMGIFERVLERF